MNSLKASMSPCSETKSVNSLTLLFSEEICYFNPAMVLSFASIALAYCLLRFSKIPASQTSLYRHIKKLRAKAYEIPIASEQKHEVVPIEVADPAEEAQAISAEGSGGMDIVSEDHQEHGSRIHIHCGSFLMDIDSGADHRTLRDTLSILQKLC